MKRIISPLLLILFSTSAFAQELFQAFEVDKAAAPRGGQAILDLFLQTNLRFPLRAEADHVSGRVFVQAIVETDGRLSNVSVLRSLRPDCDQEALRLIKSFNAWQPAENNGKPVRQQIAVPVLFKSDIPVYIGTGERIDFYASDGSSVQEDATRAIIKRIALVDSTGFPTGDITFMEKAGKRWKKVLTSRYRQTEHENGPATPYDTIHGFRQIDFINDRKSIEGNSYGFYKTGELAFMKPYVRNDISGSLYFFHPNGVVAERSVYTPTEIEQTFWYPNGQIRAVETIQRMANKSGRLYTAGLVSQWDSNGRKLVTDGKGTAVYHSWQYNPARKRYTVFTETGKVDDSRRQGIWKGTSLDGSYTYQETYQFGEMIDGWAVTTGEDTVRYTQLEVDPVFGKGQKDLGDFLIKNVRYPVSPGRAGTINVVSKAMVSFLVNTDGRVSDIEVIGPAAAGLEQEMRRLAKQTGKKWTPGYRRGKPVNMKYTLPFTFNFRGIVDDTPLAKLPFSQDSEW
ncbi:TonB family protein [Arsenicibacter rosenii]|uniref:TonB C-terminal domain-containing protein n=1 Tax=Arsenicibacter rosenii TaxID=1750698 RepID=A0A1S2VL10_9BACT|nr:TonB family protein [Arsenicibacter rosenii]OIN59090.1 hypothetical protein BLX24_12865 [Arsenicibacter rosenii]